MSTRTSEKELIVALKAKDRAALAKVVNRYEGMIRQLAFKLTQNRQDAEDITQDVFLTVLEKIGTFRGESALSSWLYRVTANASLMRLRRRRRSYESQDTDLPQFMDDSHPATPRVSWTERPDTIALTEEALGIITEAIQALPGKYRLPFVLQNMDDHSLREIGDMLGLSEAAVKIRLHRARLALRRRLATYYSHRSPPKRSAGAAVS